MRIFVGWRESVAIRRHTVWGFSLDIAHMEFGRAVGVVRPLVANRAEALSFYGMPQSEDKLCGKFATRVGVEAKSRVPGQISRTRTPLVR
jgi:hypothetical protein